MLHKISVEDMHCERCVERITKALDETGINFKVDLENRTVTVDGCENCLKSALTELEDLGFTPQMNKG